MRLYHTARRAIAEFEPRDGRAGMYVCGITPYDSAHLGHAFTYHVFDVLARRLGDSGVAVRSVRNVTDVDDDILRVARERQQDYRVVAAEEVRRFDADMAGIGLAPVGDAPRATAHVAAMVEWIRRLVDSGFAYASDGWVYFDTSRYPRYGQLSRLGREAMLALSRERGGDPADPRKRDPLDFVLWQQSLPDEPSWPSPWSEGRPGWHIECTVLAAADPGTPVDIHGGGDDLVFPHHESEIAQAEALSVRPFVRHWVHVAMVMHEGQKMSKSLGNLVFVRDLLDQVPGATVRLLLAAHHYRASWAYEAGELGVAGERLKRYEAAARRGWGLEEAEAGATRAEFLARLDDDLDTPGALAVLDRAADLASSRSPAVWPGAAGRAMDSLLELLGLRPAPAGATQAAGPQR